MVRELMVWSWVWLIGLSLFGLGVAAGAWWYQPMRLTVRVGRSDRKRVDLDGAA